MRDKFAAISESESPEFPRQKLRNSPRRPYRLPSSRPGIPPGICTVDSSASSPFNELVPIGTPITGNVVLAAITPARCAAAPAAAIRDFQPSFGSRRRVFMRARGRAMRGHHFQFIRNPKFLESFRRFAHHREIRIRTHQNSHQRRAFVFVFLGQFIRLLVCMLHRQLSSRARLNFNAIASANYSCFDNFAKPASLAA